MHVSPRIRVRSVTVSALLEFVFRREVELMRFWGECGVLQDFYYRAANELLPEEQPPVPRIDVRERFHARRLTGAYLTAAGALDIAV